MFINILKFIYKNLIIRVVILDKNNFAHYDKLRVFSVIEINTNRGPIKFIFKEDRRNSKVKNSWPFIKTFVVEIEIDDGIEVKHDFIKDKIVIVTKVVVIGINYKVLAHVLFDIYIDTFLKEYNKISKSN